MDEKGIEIGMETPPFQEERAGFFIPSMEKHDEDLGVTKHVMSEPQMEEAIEKIARAIVKRNKNMEDVVIIGIRARGVPLAHWLAKKIEKIVKRPVEVGSLDINLYRDDFSEVYDHPVVRKTELPFTINGKGIILVDDVLYTGRTIRAALDAIIDFGRPRFVQLAVLIDRGWRELPVQADYVGKVIETTVTQNVQVMVEEIDKMSQVILKDRK